MSTQRAPVSGSHLARLEETLRAFEPQVPRLEAWGRRAAQVLIAGGRLLACGNGGSAEQAQHLTTELVGRYQDERQPLAALSLTHDMTAVTAIGNDYGAGQIFARQVRAHGQARRPAGLPVHQRPEPERDRRRRSRRRDRHDCLGAHRSRTQPAG